MKNMEKVGRSKNRKKRKAALNVRFYAKKEKCANYKKVSCILRKPLTDRSAEEVDILNKHKDVTKKVTHRMAQRQRLKDRTLEYEDPVDVLAEKCKVLAEALSNSNHLIVYTGAGISTAARIPDYRGSNGIWTLLEQGKDIGLHDLSSAEPTLTHMAMYSLYRTGLLKHIVSQNCDGLHLRSGLPRPILSEVHGNMYIEVCLKCKPYRHYLRLFDVTERTGRFNHETLRICYQCNGPLKDTIVHFGERGKLQWPLNWETACKQAEKADVILCLGSSLKVLKRYPWLWCMDKRVNKRPKLYIVNLQWTPKDHHATLKINGKCDDVMEQVMSHLGLNIPKYVRSLDPIFYHATGLHDLESHTMSQPILQHSNLPLYRSDCESSSQQEELKIVRSNNSNINNDNDICSLKNPESDFNDSGFIAPTDDSSSLELISESSVDSYEARVLLFPEESDPDEEFCQNGNNQDSENLVKEVDYDLPLNLTRKDKKLEIRRKKNSKTVTNLIPILEDLKNNVTAVSNFGLSTCYGGPHFETIALFNRLLLSNYFREMLLGYHPNMFLNQYLLQYTLNPYFSFLNNQLLNPLFDPNVLFSNAYSLGNMMTTANPAFVETTYPNFVGATNPDFVEVTNPDFMVAETMPSLSPAEVFEQFDEKENFLINDEESQPVVHDGIDVVEELENENLFEEKIVVENIPHPEITNESSSKKCCNFCSDYYNSHSCQFYLKYKCTVLDSATQFCLCCEEGDEEEEEEQQVEENAISVAVEDNEKQLPKIQPGWFGKGYRKRFKKRK